MPSPERENSNPATHAEVFDITCEFLSPEADQDPTSSVTFLTAISGLLRAGHSLDEVRTMTFQAGVEYRRMQLDKERGIEALDD